VHTHAIASSEMIHLNILLGVFFLPPPAVQGLLLSCLSDLRRVWEGSISYYCTRWCAAV